MNSQAFTPRRAGFTLVEMVLVVAAMAILLGASAPPIFRFIQQRDVQVEQNNLQELRRALQAYVADRNALPPADDVSTPAVEWANALAGYTNLSALQMTNDQWGTPRAYIQTVDNTRNVQGATVVINYATFFSRGPDRTAQTAPGIAIVGTAFAPPLDSAWWSNQNPVSARVTQFGALATAGDDMMVKFTDYPEKLERYNLTLTRIDRIASALEALARVNYSETVAYCSGLPRDPTTNLTNVALCDTPGRVERLVYYPIGEQSSGGPSAAGVHRYEAIYATNNTPLADQVRVNNSAASNDLRRADMVKLMRLLGLPDDYCCSALVSDPTNNQPMPFFYFSNPRPRGIGAGCAGRPGIDAPKLPARLSTTNNDAASPPTCG